MHRIAYLHLGGIFKPRYENFYGLILTFNFCGFFLQSSFFFLLFFLMLFVIKVKHKYMTIILFHLLLIFYINFINKKVTRKNYIGKVTYESNLNPFSPTSDLTRKIYIDASFTNKNFGTKHSLRCQIHPQ